MRFSQGYMRSSTPKEQLLPHLSGKDVDNRVEREALVIVASRFLSILLSTSVLVILVRWLCPASHHASITEIAVYVMLGLNAVASRHQFALLTVKSAANSGTLNVLTRYFPARRVSTIWRGFEVLNAALASAWFLGGLVAAVPNAVQEVKQQRLEEIRAEERKTETLQERNYTLWQ